MQPTYQYSVPVFINMLRGLKGVLVKAEAFAKEKGIPEADYLDERLAPDMFPLKKQVQVASDNAKGAVARLTGREAPKMEDTESNFAELQTRINKTLAFVESVQEADFAGAEERKITLPFAPTKYLSGKEYLAQFAVPNFLFHVTTAYCIVRKSGAVIGKSDFAVGLSFKDLEAN